MVVVFRELLLKLEELGEDARVLHLDVGRTDGARVFRVISQDALDCVLVGHCRLRVALEEGHVRPSSLKGESSSYCIVAHRLCCLVHWLTIKRCVMNHLATK